MAGFSDVSYLYGVSRFIVRKHLCGYEVNPEPTFEPAGLEFFRSVIEKTATYLEFGSGGSTILAASFVKTLVSVESDRVFKTAVEKTLSPRDGLELHLLCPTIGATAQWGRPVFGRPTKRRINRWKRYPQAPWAVLGERRPDTILIDGRFRVACVLESLLNIGRDTQILFDDYIGREYSIIERFCTRISQHGRMVEFRKCRDFDPRSCRDALENSYANLN